MVFLMLALTPLPNNCSPTNTKQISQRQAPSATTVQMAPTRKVRTIKPLLAIGTYYYLLYSPRRSVHQTHPNNTYVDIPLFHLVLFLGSYTYSVFLGC
jgi:hypothetical protein